jgi:hypothetical protein
LIFCLHLVVTANVHKFGGVNGEGGVAPAIKPGFLVIDEDCGFVVNGSEVE